MNSSIAAILASPVSGVSGAATGYPVGRGDGVNTVFPAPPEITAISAVYRRDWQGTVALSPSARTNLIKYSQQLDDAAWIKLSMGTASAPVVTANAGVAPDGTMTADRIVFALNGAVDTSLSAIKTSTISYVSGTSYTWSIWLKTEDVSTKTFTMMTADGYGQTISVNGTWKRFTYTHTTTATSMGEAQIRLRGSESTSDSATILGWGGQIEVGSVVSPYIPTTTAPVTVTDYVASGTTLTLAEVPARAAELTVDGTGVNLPLLQIGG